MMICIKIGEAGELHTFDDADDALAYLNEMEVGHIDRWTRDGHVDTVIGFETPNYHGDDYVQCYQGDSTGDIMDELTPSDRRYLEENLEECFI